MTYTQIFLAPLGRFSIPTIFFMADLNKISGYEGAAGYMDTMGVPSGLLPLVIILEVMGGLAIIAGCKTRTVVLFSSDLAFYPSLSSTQTSQLKI